jgi:YegS/Rv2252/BmrU family lipid kinase
MGACASIVNSVIIQYVLLASDRKNLMKEKILLIGNPVTGHGHTRQKFAEFVRIMESKGYGVESYFTSRAGDAHHKSRCLEPDVRALVVAGGDGTLNEVINGLADPSRIPIAILPTGTSNVLANELGLPRKPKSVAQAIIQGKVRRIDMGLIGKNRFTVSVNIGIDAMITEEVFRSGKTSIGYWRYIIPVLKVLARYHVPDITVVIDGRKPLVCGLVHVGNTHRYGGIFSISDQARCDSGHLDICIFPRGSIAACARYYLAAARGRVSKIKNVYYLTGKQIFVYSQKPIAVQTDGEYYGVTPILIKIQPSTVPVIIPDK